MPRHYKYDEHQECSVCKKSFKTLELRHQYDGNLFCEPCYEMASEMGRKLVEGYGTPTNPSLEFNEPEHYHKHHIDTITFLQEGFPPEVFMGFAIGNVIKYAQRLQYKNGIEDLEKMVDYAKRAIDWHKKTHS